MVIAPAFWTAGPLSSFRRANAFSHYLKLMDVRTLQESAAGLAHSKTSRKLAAAWPSRQRFGLLDPCRAFATRARSATTENWSMFERFKKAPQGWRTPKPLAELR
jgi:hypothetical protein